MKKRYYETKDNQIDAILSFIVIKNGKQKWRLGLQRPIAIHISTGGKTVIPPIHPARPGAWFHQ
jgi:hypothetical protein